jgi:hypothetical protein
MAGRVETDDEHLPMLPSTPAELVGTQLCLRNMKSQLPTLAFMLTLAACSTEPSPGTENEIRDSSEPAVVNGTVATNTGTPATVTRSRPAPAAKVLMLDGLGDLRIGEPIPTGSKWAERGAQASDTCRTVTSPDFPGIYAIVEGGKVRRITAGQKSTVGLAEKIGVGSTEKEVRGWFAGFRAEPHEYQAAPAKYLTAPNAASGDSALRFEIGEDGKVSLVHVGTMPVLGYVEGCA